MNSSARFQLRFAVLVTCLALTPWLAAADPQPTQEAHGGEVAGAATEEHAGGEEAHGESLGSLISRLANFAILAGGLWYLLRSPVGNYLNARSQQIRQGLQDAAEMKTNAARQVEEINARMKTLPAELDALRARGAEEIAAESGRIKHLAEVERQRVVEQAQREIDLQLQAARRDLTRHAAELAVGVAASQLKSGMTAADQQQLVDRYVSDVGAGHD